MMKSTKYLNIKFHPCDKYKPLSADSFKSSFSFMHHQTEYSTRHALYEYLPYRHNSNFIEQANQPVLKM